MGAESKAGGGPPAALASPRGAVLATRRRMATMPDMPNSALPGADGPPSEASKMIVFGVSFTTTKEGFREYWAQYGELAECELMFGRDGRSRGFGFVLYRDDALNKRIMTMQHSLDGRSLDIKPKDE